MGLIKLCFDSTLLMMTQGVRVEALYLDNVETFGEVWDTIINPVGKLSEKFGPEFAEVEKELEDLFGGLGPIM
jgi:hypothetical protein